MSVVCAIMYICRMFYYPLCLWYVISCMPGVCAMMYVGGMCYDVCWWYVISCMLVVCTIMYVGGM